MAKQDDLDEMKVPESSNQPAIPDDIPETVEDEVKLTVGKEREKKQTTPYPYAQQKQVKKHNQNVTIVIIVVAAFVVLLAALVIVGMQMSRRAGTTTPSTSADVSTGTTLARDQSKTYFYNADNKPELSEEGVKALVQEAYYTADGDLAVTLSLSNGTAEAKKLVKVAMRIFNDQDATIAEKTFDSFEPACVVQPGSYGTTYLVVDKSYVKLSDDPLSQIGSTIEIEAAVA